jgi:hypothetical protein
VDDDVAPAGVQDLDNPGKQIGGDLATEPHQKGVNFTRK